MRGARRRALSLVVGRWFVVRRKNRVVRELSIVVGALTFVVRMKSRVVRALSSQKSYVTALELPNLQRPTRPRVTTWRHADCYSVACLQRRSSGRIPTGW